MQHPDLPSSVCVMSAVKEHTLTVEPVEPADNATRDLREDGTRQQGQAVADALAE